MIRLCRIVIRLCRIVIRLSRIVIRLSRIVIRLCFVNSSPLPRPRSEHDLNGRNNFVDFRV